MNSTNKPDNFFIVLMTLLNYNKFDLKKSTAYFFVSLMVSQALDQISNE